MCDTYYHEITRLTQVMDQKDYTTRTITPRTSSPIIGSEREKILESKIQRLEVDNSTLKKQITKTRTPSIGENTGPPQGSSLEGVVKIITQLNCDCTK